MTAGTRLRWALVVLLALGSAGAAARGDEASPENVSPEEIAALIDQLGEGVFAVREAATSRLIRAGIAARPLLEHAAASHDAEVRMRARLILEAVVEADFQERLNAFAADTDGSRNLDMPGWRQFSQQLGGRREARRLFVEAQRAEPELMRTFHDNPQQAAQLLVDRCKQLELSLRNRLGNQQTQIPLGSIVAVLFVAVDEQVQAPEESEGRICLFLHQPSFRNAIGGGKYQPLVRTLLGRWLIKSTATNVATSYQKVMLSMRYDMKEGLETAVAVAKKKEAPPWYRVYGVLAMGKLGGEQHLPVLESLLDDKTLIVKTRAGDKEISVELRDAALAVAIHLAGHDPKEFGFPKIEARADFLFNPQSMYFDDDEQREQVLERYRSRGKP